MGDRPEEHVFRHRLPTRPQQLVKPQAVLATFTHKLEPAMTLIAWDRPKPTHTAEAKHLKDGEEYRLRKYNEVKSMHDGFQESKRKSVEDTAIKNKMIYEQEREHVRRELGSEPYAFGGADGYSYPGYTGYGARAGGALGYSCHPNKPVQGHGYSADGKQSLGYPYRY